MTSSGKPDLIHRLLSRKFMVFFILVLILLAIVGINLTTGFLGSLTDKEKGGRGMARWTCLFYFDGDNNLADFSEMLTNLEFLQRVGSTDEVHLVCLLDRAAADDSKVLYIKKGTMDELPLSDVHSNWTTEVNMGDLETLTAMAKWTFTNYPAEHHLILLSNHGGGWRGVCWDDTSDGDNLDLADLETSLSDINDYFGRKLEILATEACLVGMIEFAYQIINYSLRFLSSAKPPKPNKIKVIGSGIIANESRL